MATTNNLGRVQGISLWVADGVVTTTGTITLTNSTMHPLINDNVIDTNGNVYKITAVSGTNPYTITTSGTPIYRITSNYTLPIASTTQLGGVKVGEGLSITPEGLLSTNSNERILVGKYNYTVSVASTYHFEADLNSVFDTARTEMHALTYRYYVNFIFKRLDNNRTSFYNAIQFGYVASTRAGSFIVFSPIVNAPGIIDEFAITGTSNDWYIYLDASQQLPSRTNVLITMEIYKEPIVATTILNNFTALQDLENTYQYGGELEELFNLIENNACIQINDYVYTNFVLEDNNYVSINNYENEEKTFTYKCIINKENGIITTSYQETLKEEKIE